MAPRALIAQIDDDGDPTMAESMRSTRVSPDESRSIWDDAYPRVERNNSAPTFPRDALPTVIVEGESWAAENEEHGEDDTQPVVEEPRARMESIEDLDANDADVEIRDEPGPVVIHAPERSVAHADAHQGMIGIGGIEKEESGPRMNAASTASIFDMMEQRYREDGHWTDLVEMLLQRVESARSLRSKAELLRKIGFVMRDHLNDSAQALDAFIESLMLEPDNEPTVLAVEQITRACGRWTNVVQTITSQLDDVRAEENGDKREVLLCEHLIRWIKAHLGRREQVEALIDRIGHSDKTHPLLHRRQAKMYREHGAWDGERESLDRALLRARDDEERKQLHLQLAELNEQKFQDYGQATMHFERVLSIDGNAMDALRGLERICRLQERFVDLIPLLEKQAEAATSDDSRVTSLLRLAELHERHFVKPQNAAPRLEEVLKLAPHHEDALLGLERCYHAMRAWGDLVRTLDLRAEATKKKAEKIAFIARGAEILETTLGDPERASHAYRRIYNIDDRDTRAITELARLCERAADWQGAAAYRARLADIAPTTEAKARIHTGIGDMLAGKEKQLARVHYERATAIHPSYAPAWEALEREARKDDAIDRVAGYLEMREKLAESPRQKALLLVELAKIRISLGEDALGEDAYERAVALDPTNEAAADAVLRRYVDDERWSEAQPLCDLLTNAAARDGAHERAFELLRMGTQIASALGSHDRALTAALAAFSARPTLEAREDLLSVCHAAREDSALLHRARAALDAIEGATDLNGAALVKLADIRRAQGLGDGAVAAYVKAATRDPENRTALAALAETHIERGEWERACAVKRRLADSAPNEEEQFTLLVDAGELWARRAQNLPMAALAYEEALTLRPSDRWLLHILVWLYGELEHWQRLVEALRAVADNETDATKKAVSVFAMAQVLRDKLEDAPRALEAFDETLDLDPKRLEAFERIVRIQTELRDWNELKNAYGRMLRRLKGDGEVELRHALFFQLGLIFRDRLGDPSRALDSFRAAARLKPDAEDVRRAVCELLVVANEIGQAVTLVRAAIARKPQDAAPYGELYSLFLRQRAFDKAWNALDAFLATGGQPTSEQARFYNDYPPRDLSAVPGALTAEAWRSHIFHKELEPTLTAVFTCVMPAVLRARLAVTPQAWLAKALGPPLAAESTSAVRVLTCVHDASEILGISEPALHATKGPVPLAPSVAHPAMVVSLEACDALDDSALNFAVGKRVGMLRPELAARAVFATVTELTALLQTAVQLARNEAPPSTSEKQATFDKALRETMTREERHALRAILKEAHGQRTAFDVARWAQLADVSAARLGLLLAGNLEAVKRVIQNEPQAPGDLSPRDKLNDVLVFAVSDEYADLRAAIGVAVE